MERAVEIKTGTSKLNWWACALLCALVWVTYGKAISAPFIFDDHFSISRNESIRSLWPPTAPFKSPRNLPFSGRPLVNLSAAVNFYFGGLDPTGYRAFNIALHAGSTILLFLIVDRSLRQYRQISSFRATDGITKGLAFAAAALWAIHPLQTETVCYVTQRTELMAGVFLFATLYGSLRFWDAPENRAQRIWLMVAVTACAAGMASKEIMVAAPPLVLLYERTFVRREFRGCAAHSFPLYIGLGSTLLLLLYLNIGMPREASAGFNLDVSPLTWWLTQCNVLLMYLGLVVWPWPLTIHYEIPYLHSLGESWYYVLPVALMILGTAYATWRNWPVGYLGAWFFLILAPTMIVPIITEVAVERRMHLPLAAISVGFVVGGYRLLAAFVFGRTGESNQRKLVTLTAILLLVVPTSLLEAVTWHRLSDYRDEATLWRGALAIYPNSATSHLNLGFALMNHGGEEEAIREFIEALRLKPDYHEAHFNWGTVLDEQGKTTESLPHFAKAVELLPGNFEYRRMYGAALTKLKKYPEAIEQYHEALRIIPDSVIAQDSLGFALKESGQLQQAAEVYAKAVQLAPFDASIRNRYGNVLRQLKRYEEAQQQFEEAIRISPKFASARTNLGLTLESLGKLPEAVNQLELALAIDPSHADTHYFLGNALLAQGRPEDAVRRYEKAIELDPSQLEASTNLGATLLELGRVDEAIAQLERAASAAPESAVTEFNLAVAYAKGGRSDEAVSRARAAHRKAMDQGNVAVARQMDVWIESQIRIATDGTIEN